MKRDRRQQVNDRRSDAQPPTVELIQGESNSNRIHQVLGQYLADIRQLQNESSKTHRFAMLLGDLYLDPHLTTSYAASIEKRILRIDTSNGLKNGRADSYHGNAVIEFENSLKATGTHAKEQLREYVSGIWNSEKSPRRPLLAIATDGILWQTYRPSFDGKDKGRITANEIRLDLLREFSLSTNTFTDYWIWLTSLLYRPQQVTPTAEQRGGSGWLDSFCQFISGAWRIADYAAVCRVVRLSE